MNRKRLALLLFILALMGASLSAVSAAPEILSARIQKPTPTTEVLIGLPVPAPGDFRDGALPRDAGPSALAHAVAHTAGAPILQQLDQLRRMGRIRNYEIDAAQFAVRVTLDAGADAAAVLGQIDGASYKGLADAGSPAGAPDPACAAGAQAASMAAARAAQMAEQHTADDRRSGAANLNVAAYVVPGSTYSSVYGFAAEEVEVIMRVRRAGRVVIEESTFSYSDGYYAFYPDYGRCPDGYNWTIFPGDVIEVQAAGEAVSTVVMEILAQLDAANKVLRGTVRGGPLLTVQTSTYWDTPADEFCYSSQHREQINPDSNGAFELNLGGITPLNNTAESYVTALDPGSGATERYVGAYRLTVDKEYSEFWGVLPPNAGFAAELRRGGAAIATYAGTTYYDGYFYGWFSEDMQTGDVIVASARGVEQRFVVVDQSLQLDYVSNSLVGMTAPDHTLRVYFYNDPYQSVDSGCNWDSQCAKGQSAANGTVGITSSLDLRRGDYARVFISDAAGNSQYLYRVNSPAIQAEVGWHYIYGYFSSRNTDLTMRLLDSSEALKEEYFPYAGYDGYFSAYFNETIMPGDIIEVTDGASLYRMTVQDVGGRLNSHTDELSVAGPDGPLVIQTYKADGVWGSYYDTCDEGNLSGGSVAMSLGDVAPGDWVYATLQGPDGNYTFSYLPAFSFSVDFGEYTGVYGTAELPGQQVVISQIRGGPVIATETLTADNHYFGTGFDSILPGDRFQIAAGNTGGDVEVPTLTAALDTANNRTVGQSPVLEPVRSYLQRYTTWGWDYASQVVHADDVGAYAADWVGWFWYNDCSDITAGHRCSGTRVNYYDDSGFGFNYYGPPPPPAPADSFEDDNTPATAKDYQTADRTHTFHEEDDVDWIRFTVPAAGVGRTYRIDTMNRGWGLYPIVTLYAQDGQTPLASDYERLEWVPAAAGTYLLKVEPNWGSPFSMCDGYYDLVITSLQNYLPTVSR